MESCTKSDDPHLPNTEQVHVHIQPPSDNDIEKGRHIKDQPDDAANSPKQSVFKSLGWLDRFLAIWIFLAMAIGIILGNFVPEIGDALQKGQFVGVSVPIGALYLVIKRYITLDVLILINP